jgi:hypothetical protein
MKMMASALRVESTTMKWMLVNTVPPIQGNKKEMSLNGDNTGGATAKPKQFCGNFYAPQN